MTRPNSKFLPLTRPRDAADRKIRCFRRKVETINQDISLEKNNRRYGSVNVWGGIMGPHKISLILLQDRITSETYIWDVKEEYVMPFLFGKPNSILFAR